MAPSASGLRERRIAQTSEQMIAVARAWTLERGFGGFTIDELCIEVGVSRRTFFNYFGSKEDAVLGIPNRIDHTDAESDFVSAGSGLLRVPFGLTPTLLDDLAELLITRWEALGMGVGELDTLLEVIQYAPRLLSRALQISREQERDDIALVEQREGLPVGDLRAGIVVHLLGSILRGAVEESFTGIGREPLRATFARRLAAARSVFTS